MISQIVGPLIMGQQAEQTAVPHVMTVNQEILGRIRDGVILVQKQGPRVIFLQVETMLQVKRVVPVDYRKVQHAADGEPASQVCVFFLHGLHLGQQVSRCVMIVGG